MRSWRKLCRRGQADPNKLPVYVARAMRLELWSKENSAGLCRFHGDAIQIRVRAGEYLWLPLLATEHHEQAYLRDWYEGKSKVGEISVSAFGNKARVYVPFKREVELKPAEGICGVDVNERSLDLCILKLNQAPRHIRLDTSKLAAIAHSMELKQKSIQEKLDAVPQCSLQKRRLKLKYSRRRRNRTRETLHVVSKRVTEVLTRERVEPVFEDLTWIRRSMQRSRKSLNGKTLRRDIRRRLNQWPFRKLQFYVEYKTLRHGCQVHYLPREQVRGTSSTCPTCGSHVKPNGHAFTCKVCRFTADRHFIGAFNEAVRWWSASTAKDVGSSVPPEWCQMQPSVEEPVAPVKPRIEAQRPPLLRFATEI